MVSAGTIFLVLQGTGLGAHYKAVFPFQLTPPSRTPHPLQHTNTTPQHTNSRAQFDPTEVQPLPKAGPSNASVRGRKRRVTAILTDKNALATEQLAAKSEKVAAKGAKSAKKAVAKKKKTLKNASGHQTIN